MSDSIQSRRSATVAVVLSWLFVGFPAAWGIFNTVRQATLLWK